MKQQREFYTRLGNAWNTSKKQNKCPECGYLKAFCKCKKEVKTNAS